MTRRESWRQWVLAGLPHLLFPLAATAAPAVRHLGVFWADGAMAISWLGNATMVAFAGAIVVMLILAWRGRWPRWSASWIGYALVVPWIAPFWLASRVPSAVAGPVLCALILISFGVGFLMAGRDRLSGLLVALAAPMGWSWADSSAAHSAVALPLFIGAGLATALAAGAIVRSREECAGARLAIWVTVLARVPLTYVRLQHHDYLPPAMGPTAVGVVAASVRDAAMAVVLVTEPLWAWALWERAWRRVARGMAD
jgi:hypothetical protein